MRKSTDERVAIAIVAPTLPTARSAEKRLRARQPDRRFLPFSLDRWMRSMPTLRRIVLCPSGSDVAGDLAFLEEARVRLLWSAPPPALRAAIEGLLGQGFPRKLPRPSPGRTPPGLLLEGAVTRQRARRALESDARLWIVERAERVRLSRRELDRFWQCGVRWVALQPVRVVALLATRALARERSRWRSFLPPQTPVWTWRR